MILKKVSNPKHLEFVYELDELAPKQAKKYGTLTLREQLGSSYVMRLVDSKGHEVWDKDVWDDVCMALAHFKKNRVDNPAKSAKMVAPK